MFHEVTAVVLLCLSVNGNPDINTTIGYDAEDLLSKIFAGNLTQLRRLIKFEDQFESNHVSFDDQTVSNETPVKFEVNYETNKPVDSNNNLKNIEFDHFGENVAESEINPLGNRLQPNNGKKKRRRRKPKQRFPGQAGFQNPGQNGPLPVGHGFGPAPFPGQGYGFARPGQNFEYAPGPGQNFGPYRFQPDGQYVTTVCHKLPRRRPQSSVASDALGAITGALTSIAHNDDYQCVARLLCEAAAGGALGGSSLLDSVSGLQPLLTLLSAYNGISSNPLFVFGRAAFLGMSSKGNPGSCRYAYPLCPTDPEQLVHYLNNHNGGFFRFFNAPQTGQQNLEQFYNQLSQNYGLYRPIPDNNLENYGLYNPGLPQSQPNLYPNGYGYEQNYGFAYPHNQNHHNSNGIRFKNHINFNDNENKIEERIQNKPATYLNDNAVTTNSKWSFPGENDEDFDDGEVGIQYIDANDFRLTENRKDRKLKFPGDESSYDTNNVQEYNDNLNNLYSNGLIRKPKGIPFPENQKNNDYSYSWNKYYNSLYSSGNQNQLNNGNRGVIGLFSGVNNHNNHKDYRDHDEPGVTTVYVVRGNGDPNNPEIVKLRPGQSL